MAYYDHGFGAYVEDLGGDARYYNCSAMNYNSNYKGLCILKYYSNELNRTYYTIVGADGQPITIDPNESIMINVNNYTQSHSQIRYGTEYTWNHIGEYTQPPSGSYTDALMMGYIDHNNPDAAWFEGITLPIFNVSNNDTSAFQAYNETGDDSGADNYQDLHPLKYRTTVWLDGNYPNVYYKTEVLEGEPTSGDMTATFYATPATVPEVTLEDQYFLDNMVYHQYSEYAKPSKIPSLTGGTQSTPYVIYFNPAGNTDPDYDCQITFYVKADGTVENIDVQSSPNHNLIKDADPTPTDTDYPEDTNGWDHDPTYVTDPDTVNTLTQTYRLNVSQLRALGNFLWSNTFKDNILGLTQYPLDNLVALKAMPLAIGGGTDNVEIKIGNVATGINAYKVRNDANCYRTYVGELNIGRPFDNFADYSEVVLTIYLPFIGFKPLDNTMVMGRKIEVYYIWDVILGNCMSVLYVYDDSGHKNMFAAYQGNCGIDIAITATNRAQIENGYVNSALDVVSDIMSGNILGIAKDAYNGMTQDFHSQSNGCGNPSLMNRLDTTCYVLYKRPQSFNADKQDYGKVQGYPCYLKKRLGSLSGWTVVDNFDTSQITGATEGEKQELKQLLESGVYM